MTSQLARAMTLAVVLAALVVARAEAQARGGEWTTSAGDAQRTSTMRSDHRLSIEAVRDGDFAFLWKAKFDNQTRQLSSLTEPILLDRLIGYRGFKALAFIGGSADRLFSIDTDLGRPYWTTHVTYAAATGGQPPSSWECPGGLLATPSRRVTLAPSSFGGGSGNGGGSGAKSAVGEPGRGAAVLSEPRRVSAPPRDAAPPTPVNPALAPVPFGGVDPLYAMGSDGLLRTLRVSDGTMTAPMATFLPPNARPSSLTFINGVVYTSTSHGCGAAPNGVWALDLIADNKVTMWNTGSAHVAGGAGPTFGTDGTVFVALTKDTAAKKASPSPATSSTPQTFASSVVALDGKTLQPRDWLTADAADFNASPVIFKHGDRELLAASGNDGRLYLLDAASLGGADHRTPLFVTPKYTAAHTGGGLATWEADGTRWVLASVEGAPAAGLTFAANGLAPSGSVVAFKLIDTEGALSLAPVWRSPGLVSPLPPMVVNGLALVASSGEYRRGPATLTAAQRRSLSTPAVLYVLDATTGKPLWNSGQTMTSSARARLVAGSAQVYLVTLDNQLYAFGIPMEH